MSSVRKAGASGSNPYTCAEDLNTTLRTGESAPLQAARMLRVACTLTSRTVCTPASSGSAIRRVSMTVSIAAAVRIRRSSV